MVCYLTSLYCPCCFLMSGWWLHLLLPRVLSVPRNPTYTSCLAIVCSASHYTNHSKAFHPGDPQQSTSCQQVHTSSRACTHTVHAHTHTCTKQYNSQLPVSAHTKIRIISPIKILSVDNLTHTHFWLKNYGERNHTAGWLSQMQTNQ